MDPIPDDPIRTALVWGYMYKLCQIKHEMAVECLKQKAPD